MKVHLLVALLIGACYADNDVCDMSDGSIGKCVKSGQCKVPDLGNLNVFRTIQMVCQTGEVCCDFKDIIQTSFQPSRHNSPITINNYVKTSNTNLNINYNYFNFTDGFQRYFRQSFGQYFN